MTDQHRATPEQQARDMLERMGVPDAQSYTSGDLVELASLIAASQHRAAPEQWASPPASAFHADPIPVVDRRLRDLRDRVEALERAQPQPWAVPPGFQPLIQRSDLVARIIEAAKREPYGTAGVRAVIHAVADWLDERDTSIQSDPDCLEAPFADDAIRWLREEARE